MIIQKLLKKPTTAQPIEYKNLTIHETNLLGICYEMGGAEWPSHKKLYQSYHNRAYAHYLPRTNKYFSFNTTNGKLSHQMKLINSRYINHKSTHYRKELRKKCIILPDIAFHYDTPPFVLDILMLPHIILKDYGFIL